MEALSNDLVAAIKKYKNILIAVKGSPDPDALASSYALSVICRRFNIASSIIMTKHISLPANRAFVKLLKIPVSLAEDGIETDGFDAYIVADHQSPSLPAKTGTLPCAAFIDHHETGEEAVKADFILTIPEAGAASSIVALLIKNLPVLLDAPTMTSVATALLYGIYTDTDKYSHSSMIDYEALEYISRFADNALFQRISSVPLSKKTMQMLRSAVSHQVIYKDWLVTGIGYIDSSHRDSIALVADFLLKREKPLTVIVFAAVENEDRRGLALDASFRTSSDRVDLNDIIRRITPQGGARKFKGAYQIDIDYFALCPDRKLLWDLLELATIEHIKMARDNLPIIELKGFYRKFRRRINGYFRK